MVKMSTWLILVLVILLGVFFAFKWNNYRTRLAYIFIFLGVGFLILTGLILFSDGKVNFEAVEGVSSAAKTYLSWFINAGSNMIEITTYAFSQEWDSDDLLNRTQSGR